MGLFNSKEKQRVVELETEMERLQQKLMQLERQLDDQSEALAASRKQLSGESQLNELMEFENRQLKAGLGIVQSDLAGSVESAKLTLGCAEDVRGCFTGLNTDISKITQALDSLASLSAQAEGSVPHRPATKGLERPHEIVHETTREIFDLLQGERDYHALDS